ncbi:hypothetical protein RhiTH_010405 [Rhizoctonia solani]
MSNNCPMAPPPPPPPSGIATTSNIPPPAPITSSSDLKFAKPNKFSDTNRDEKYQQKWNNLRQKASVQEYTREFQQYLVSLGYSDKTLRNKYYDGLKNEIKDIMLSTMFQWRRATAQQVYDKAEEIANHIESTCLSNPSTSTARITSTAVPTSTSNPTPTCTCLNVGDNVYMINPTTRRAKKGAITSIVRTTSGNMPNVRWNGETKDTMIPFPSLKKDERPAAAAPVKPIVAPIPIPAATTKGPGPMDLDGRGFANLTCICVKRTFAAAPLSPCLEGNRWSWESPRKKPD